MKGNIKLGNITLKSNVILAPMAGVTDLPFRKIARKFGQFLMYSEMVASQAVIRNVKRTHAMMDVDNDPLTAVQLVGADPNVMAEAAKVSCDMGAKILDINMGCPVKKVVKTDAGSALMKDPILAQKIIRAVVAASTVPVTLKLRLGWDETHINAPEIAKIAEDLGVQMITVHGRTRAQLYSGKANWEAVKLVKNAVKIPVIVNGDITSPKLAKIALRESGADGVMIGRGALGSPWLLLEIHNELAGANPVELNIDRFDIMREHIDLIKSFYPEKIAIILAKKTVMYYCKGLPNASKLRQIASESARKFLDPCLS